MTRQAFSCTCAESQSRGMPCFVLTDVLNLYQPAEHKSSFETHLIQGNRHITVARSGTYLDDGVIESNKLSGVLCSLPKPQRGLCCQQGIHNHVLYSPRLSDQPTQHTYRVYILSPKL